MVYRNVLKILLPLPVDILKKKLRKQIPFIVESKKRKYLRINLTEEKYTESYKRLLKQMKDLNKKIHSMFLDQKTYCCCGSPA